MRGRGQTKAGMERHRFLVRTAGHYGLPTDGTSAGLATSGPIRSREQGVLDAEASCLPRVTDRGFPLSHVSSLRTVAGAPPQSALGADDPAALLVRPVDRCLALRGKRAFDAFGAAALLVVLLPVMAFVAALILLRDGRPILFIQERVGLDGSTFRLVKFRTMVRDAEDRYEALAPFSDTLGAAFKLWDDPRVTGLGLWLRRSSLDVLPQLWNVLRGEMSFVGPRPATPREVARYDPWHRQRLSMKPGMTGLWQVASRFDHHFDERVGLDLEYIERWSLRLDLVILMRTVPAVLALTGR